MTQGEARVCLAVLAAEMIPMLQAEARERQRAGGEAAGRGRPQKVVDKSPQAIDPSVSTEIRGKSRDIAARNEH